MPDAGTPTMSVKGVSKRFGGLVAVDNMSFEIARNEMLGLIGPNGSGKTTMLNLISGALKPSVGTILLEGEDISAAAAS
jgi:branched-chain amino acid transport system ATP-binding protein